MARKYPYDTSAAALLTPAKHARFFEQWDPVVDTRNHPLLCAEMSRLAYASDAVVTAALAQIGFAPVGFFGGETLATRLATLGTEGFVARNPTEDLTVLAFRGTEPGKVEDVFSDIDTTQVDFPGGGRAHAGFVKAYQTVRARIAALLTPRTGRLLITGHSLGAGLGTLATLDHAPTALITFGSPRVGDARFCERFRPGAGRPEIFRFVDCCDVVTRVPPERFERDPFFTLFNELGNFERLPAIARKPAETLAKAVARGLEAAFSGAVPKIEFSHVAPARYIRFDGTIVDNPTGAAQTQDQWTARRAYPHSTEAELGRLVKLLTSLGASAARRDALRNFTRGVFGLVRGDLVQLRDLADHAPINYVSGIAGRAV